jgi:anthranilate phosphoribosyltransferase
MVRIDTLLSRLEARQDLSLEEMEQVLDLMLQGQVPQEVIARLLTLLAEKGETADEIAGAARAMRRHMTPIRSRHPQVLDTCGTGGVGSCLLNVSTASALVVAASGIPVAKHGNRSVTSKSGSADVLEALGVAIDAPVEVVEQCLDELGICFCFAPRLHPAMRHVAAVRRALGFATIFNLLGPLCNPAGATRQLLGVGLAQRVTTMAEVVRRLGTERTVVVHGTDGIGEVSLAAPTQVLDVQPGGIFASTWQPADFGLSTASWESLRVASPQESATRIRQVLAGQPGPARDMVLLNAAAALWTAGWSMDLAACTARAAEAIDQGAAARLLDRWIALSRQGC